MDSFKRILTFLMTLGIECLIFFPESASAETPLAQDNNYQTNEKHEQLLSDFNPSSIIHVVDNFPPSTELIKVNGIYFKGLWKKKFNKSNTKPGIFYNNGDVNNGKAVPMMNQLNDFRFKNYSTFSALELPYEGCNISMFLLLPHETNGIQDLEKILTHDSIRSINDNLRSEEVNVTVPILHLEYSKALNDDPITLGMPSAFTSGANLSGISDSAHLALSSIFHKAVCNIDEEGTEAAAVTKTAADGAAPHTPITITFNRPFLFYK